MSLRDLLDRVNWFLRWVAGEYSKLIGAFLAWQAGIPLSFTLQINQARFRFVSTEGPEAGVRRRLVIDELI